ncbi:MAG: CPBP family intramembrane glutamic endopeptidase [Bacteroidota bacterium]
MKIQPILQQKPPYLQLLFFMMILLASLILVNLLGVLLAIPFFGRGFVDGLSAGYNLSSPEVIAKLKYLQIVNQVAMFLVPVAVFALFSGGVFRYVKLSAKIPWLLLLLAVCVMVVGLPFINWIGEVNANLSLPRAFSGVEQWMRASETEADNITTAFLSTTTLGGFLVNLLMIAVLPALGEELFFRGTLQKIFSKWFKNIHVSVLVTAFIFSAIHFQFFGFLPRFLLGMFLGYAFYWARNLWVPIAIHFVNNALAVVVAFLAARGAIQANFDTFGSSSSAWIVLLSTLTVAVLVFLLYRLRSTPQVDTSS